MLQGGLRLAAAGVLALALLPALAQAGSTVSASYSAAGVGEEAAFDQTTGEWHGLVVGAIPVTVVPPVAFHVAGAVADDSVSQHPPLAICVGDPTAVCSPADCVAKPALACAGSITNVILGVKSVSERSVTGWPAGTPVNIWALNVATQSEALGPLQGVPVPQYGTSGTLFVSWD
jgi:hypothetical protein